MLRLAELLLSLAVRRPVVCPSLHTFECLLRWNPAGEGGGGICTNDHLPSIKMAAMPMYGKTLLFFSRNNEKKKQTKKKKKQKTLRLHVGI